MATGVHIQEPVLDTLRREDENEKMMDQASYITLGKVPLEVNLGAGHTPIVPQDTLETDFDVKDSVEGNEGSASTTEGEKFLKSPSAAEVYFEENSLSPDACQVTENAEKMATEHETDASHVGEAKLDAEESNGLEKGLVSKSEVAVTREVGHDESKPVHEAGLSENREDRERTVPEEEAAHMESLNVNPDDAETTSSVEEKSMTSTPQVIGAEKIEQTTSDTNEETPENVSAIVPNKETEQNLSIEVDDSQVKTDENLEKEDEKPESTLVPEGKIKDDESTQNELFGTKDDTERVIQESEEVIEKRAESSPVAASEAEDIKATTSDHDGETSALENQIPTENPQEIEGDKSECKTEKETLQEQVQDVSTLASVSGEDDAQGIHEAHLEKESEKPCSTDASTRDASHDETMPVDKTRTEDEEPSKSDLLETKEDTESTILVEEPIMEKHLESLNATPDDSKACDSVQDTETKSSIEEKLLTATPQEISGDEIEKTAFDMKEETPEDISTIVSNEETEQNSTVEVPFVTEALTIDNELAITEGKIKDEDRREEGLLENKNDTESELLKQEVMEKPVESSKLANEAEDTKVATSDHDTQISALESQIPTENPQEIVGDDTESKIVDTKNETLDVQKDASTIESNDDKDENSVIEEDEIEKPFLREESTRDAAGDDAAGDESTYTHEDKIEGEDQRRAELFKNPSGTESMSLIEEATTTKLVESPQVDAEDIKTHVSDQETEKTGLVLAFEEKSNDGGDSAVKDEVKTEDDGKKEDEMCDNEAEDTKVSTLDHDTKTSALENQILTENPREIVGDDTESKIVDTKNETLDVQNVSKIESNDGNEENLVIEEDESEQPLLREESTRNAAGDESTYTHEDKIEGKNEGRAELFETPSSAESTSLVEEATIPKLVESPPVDAEDIKTHVSDQDAEKTGDGDSAVKDEVKTEDNDQREDKVCDNDAEATKVSTSDHDTETIALENQILTENPQEIVGDETESKIVDTKNETLDVQDVSTIESNDDNKNNSVIDEDESEKPLLREESTRDAAGDESTYTHEDKIEGEEQRRAELFENPRSAESTLLIEEATIPKLVESPPVDAEDIKTHVSDQDAEKTGLVLAFGGKSNDGESAVKYEVKTEVDDQKEDELCDNEKNFESSVLPKAEQIETPIESLQETLPSTVPRGFLDVKTEEKSVDAIQKDEDEQNVTTTVSNEKVEENSLIQLDGSQIQHVENLEKEHEIPSVIEASTKHANDDELIIINEDNLEHEDLRNVEMLESEKDTEINLQKNEAQIETHIKPLQVDAEDIIASDSYQGTETTNSQEERFLNENEIVHGQTEVEKLDSADTMKETPEALDVSAIVLNDDNEENSVIVEDESQTKNEDNLGPFIEASRTDASGDDSTGEDKNEGEEQTRAELFEDKKDTESTLLKEEETAVHPFESRQVDAEDIKTYVSDQVTETTGLVEVFKGVANDEEPEVKCTIKTEDKDQKEDELCDNVAEMEKPFESLKEALPTLVPRGFLDEKTEEKTIDATEKDEETHETQQNVATIVSDENDEDDSLLEVDGSQMQHEEYSEEESETTLFVEASTMNVNDDDSINVHEDSIEHEDLRKDELVESKEDTKITSQKEEAQVETSIKSLNIAADDIIASDSCQETETSSQEEHILNKEEIVREQIEVKTLDTNTKAQDVSTIVPDDREENSGTGENDLQIKNDENFGEEREKPSVTEASTTDASGDGSTNKCEDKIQDEEHTGAELFEGKKDMEGTLLKEEEIKVKHVESPQVDIEDIKTYVSDEGAKTTGEVEASEGDANNDESAVKYEVKTEDNDQKEDEMSDNEKKPEIGVLLDAAQIESLQETLPSTVPRGFLDDKTEEKTADAIQKDDDIQNVTRTVSNEKTEENSLIQLDGSQIQHEENLEKEHEIPSVIEASTKQANDDELIIINEDNLEHEDLRNVEMLESEKDIEINLQKNEAQIETHIKSLQVAAEDIIASHSYQGTETTNSQEERILNENEIVHEQTEVEKLDTADTMKETPEALDVSAIVLNDDKEENSVIGEDESQTKNEDNLGKESEKPPFMEASRTDASGDDSTGEDKIEGKEQMRAELLEDKKDTESTLLKEDETVAQPLESPQVDAEIIKTYVSDQVTETTGLVEVFKGVANDEEPEVKCTIKTEDKGLKEDELCDNEKIPDSTLLPEVAEMEKPFESLKEALPTLVPRGFLDEKTEEQTIDATEKDKETHETQNVATIVSNEDTEDDSLLEVDGSQMRHKEYSEEESEITPFVEASTMNVNDDDSLNVHEDSIEHEDLRKDELAESKEDTKITSQKEEAQVEMPVNSLNIAADDIIASDSCQETETSSQDERILNKEEIVCEQIEVETLGTKTKTPEAQDVSTIVPDDREENSGTGENDLQIKNDENFGEEREKPSVTEALTTDASGDGSTNKCEGKIQDEEHTGAELFEGKKDMEGTLLKEEEIKVKHVESPQVDIEDIKTYVSDEGAKTTGVVDVSEGDANNDESAVKYEVKTEDNDQKEDEMSDNEKKPEIAVLLDAAQIEKPIESLQETLPSTVPRGFLDDKTGEKIADAIQKDEDIQNVTTTVSHEKIEENSLIPTDGSQIQHEEHLEKEHEIPSVIEASTKHANDDELITINEDNLEHEDLRNVEMLESEKDTEINLQNKEAQIETNIKSFPVAAEDIIASDSYQGTETTNSQEKRILNENEIMHEQTLVEKLDTADTMKETPKALDVSAIVLNDDNEEKSVIGEDDSQTKNKENLGKESEKPPFIEGSRTDASGDESTGEDKIEGEEQRRAELLEDKKDTESTLLKEEETVAQPHESPQVDAEIIKTYVSDQVTETTGLVEVFKGVANDEEPEVKCTIKTEDKGLKEDELCDNEKIPDSTLLPEVAEMEKPFESLKEALPTLVPRGFLDEKTEEKTIDATEKDKETHETQNVATIVSNEDAEDDSLLEVDGSQMQRKEYSEEENEITPFVEASTMNVNDDNSINVHEDSIDHEDLRKDELAEIKEDTKITLHKEEAEVETLVKSLNIAADDIIASDSCQETETSSQEEHILNKEEIVCEQTEVETLDTKTKTPEPQDVSTIVPDDSDEHSGTGENDLQIKNEENFGDEREKSSVTEASTIDASGDGSTNKCEDKIQGEGEEHTGAELFEGKKDIEGTLLKEEEIKVKLVESPQVDIEDIKTYVSDEGAKTTGVVEASEGDANNDESAVKYEVKTEDNDQKEDEMSDNEKKPEIGVLLEAAEIEKPIESLKETLPGTVPRGFLDDKTEEKTMDAIEKDKEILDVQNVAKTVSNEKIEDDSLIQTDGSEIQHGEYLEKESEIPSVIEASTKHANDDELISIHEDNIEHKNLKEVEFLESKEDTEINLQKDEAPVKSSQEAAEDIIASDSYHGTETTSQEEQLLNENDMVHEQTDVEILDTADIDKETPEAQNFATMLSSENIPENSRIPEDGSELKHEELFDKESTAPPLSETLTMEANDEMPEIIHQDKIEDEKLEIVDKLEFDEHEEITLLNQEAPVEKLNESSKEDLENIKDIVSGANTTERSLIEVQSLNEIPQETVGDHMEENIVDKNPEEIEDEHLDKDVTFENEKHTEIGFIKEEEPMKKLQEPEKNDLEEIKAFLLHEGTDTTSSIEERGLTEVSQESVGDPLDDTVLAKAREIPDFTPIVSDEHTEINSSIQPDGSQMKHEETTETETSFLNSDNNESTTVHEEKIENEHLNKVDIAIINDEAPVEELQESSKRDLREVKETISIDEQGLTEIPQETVGDLLKEKTIDKVGTSREFTNIISDENGEDVSLIPVDGSQIEHEDLLEKESETPPLSLLNSSNEKLIEHEVPEKADKSECVESGAATLLNEESSAEKLIESSKDLEDIKESITYTEITSSTQEQNLTTISQAVVDDQVEEKVLNVAREASDFTTIITDNNTERNLLVEVDESQMKNEEHLEKESEMPSVLMSNTSTEEPTIVHENKTTEHAEIILSNEEALENSSKEENIKASVSCEDTETSSIEQQSLIADPHEIVVDQIKEKKIDIAQDAPDLTTITSEGNAEENSLIQLVGSQIKHEESLEKESETPSLPMLNTTTEESTIVQDCRIDDEDLRKVDEFEPEINTEAISLKEHTPAEKVIESTKEDLGDTKVFPSCEDRETRSSTEEQSQKANQQETVVDQTQENILNSTTKAQDFEQTVSHENAGENSLIQVDESQVEHEIVGDPTQENVLDTAPEDQDFEPAISHENAEEHALIQVDELQKKHDELEKENEKPSSLLVDTSINEPRIIYEDITEDENLQKVHDFECEKHEEITSTEEEAQVRKVNESSKEDLQDVKALVSGEDTETTSFVEKQSLKENPQEILSDQPEEKILCIAPEAQNFIKVVSNENVEKDSLIQEDGSQMAHKEILEEGEIPSLSAALMLNTTDDDSIVIHEKKIEHEDLRKVDIFECEKYVDDKILDAAPEAPEFKIIVSDENTEEKSLDQYNKSQVKHEELLEKESKTLSLSETSLLISSNEDSTTINKDKIEDEDPDKVDKLECEKHTEFPLTEKEAPSSLEDPNLQTKPQEVVGDQMEENIIDTTPEIQNFTTIVSDENTKENLSLDVGESPIKHEELSENESEKPVSSLKTSNEESSFICDSKTENEDVKRVEKLECVGDIQITESKNESSMEQLDDYPKEGPESIKVSVSCEDKEITGPLEERILTANPQENLLKDKIPDVVPEAPELKTIVSDKNIDENSIILEDGSKSKHEERSEKESEMPSLMETSILNTRNDEPALLLNDRIENEDQAKVNKSEYEKHAEITEVLMGNLRSSNQENIEVSRGDIETTNSTEEQNLTVNPIENVCSQNGEKVLDKAFEAQDFTPIVPDDNNESNSLIQVDESQMKHEEPLEEESKFPSLLENSLLNTNNEESATIHKDKIEDEALKNVDEFESEKNSEINKLEEEAQVEESTAYKDIKADVSYQGTDTEASDFQEQILTANPQDTLGNKSEDQVIDTADSKEKITENLTVSNENIVQDSLIQMDESEVKHEEILEKESEIPYLTKTSTVEANIESTIIHEDMIEEESGKIVESTLLNEESQANESVESLQVASEDIKASVSCQNSDTTSSILNADPREIAGDQTDDKINIAGTREITPEALNLTTLVSKENEVQDSFTPQDGLGIKHEDISEKESEVQFFTKTSMLADNDEESMIIQEDTIGSEGLKNFDKSGSAKQTENTLLKDETHVDESMESLQVASEHIKASVSCQDTDPTSSLKERIHTTPQETMGDQVEEKVTDTAKAWEKTPEVTSSIFVFHEDEANRTAADDINSGMTKDEETLNRDTSSNAAENDEICATDKVQAKEEEKEIISERKSDEEEDKDDSWIKLTEDEANKTCIEVKNIDFSFHAEDTFDIAQLDDAKDIPKGNENSTAKNEFLEEGCSKESTESTTSIVSKDLEQVDKDIKAETVITETGTASDALQITGVQCGQEENESEDSKVTEIGTSLAPEGGENQVQLTKLHESPLLSHIKDSEQEITRGTDNHQSGSDIIDDMQELDEVFVAISNKGNFFEANSNEDIETDVTTGGKEASAIHKDPVSKFVVQEIQEQPGKTVEDVSEEKGIKSEEGKIKNDDSDDLINSSILETDKVAPSDIVCGSTSDAGQRAVDQETQIVVQEEEQIPGKGKAIEAAPEDKGINVEADEIKEHDFNVLKENSSIVALDKVTPVNFFQGSTTDAAQWSTGEETPEQHGLDQAGLKEIEAYPASTTDKLTVLKAEQTDDANFDISGGSNKIPVLQHGDSSESSQTEGEKQKTLKLDKGEKCENKETAKPMETSESTETDKPSLSGLLQEPVKEVSKIVDHLVDKKEATTHKEELPTEKSDEADHVEAKTDEEKDGEEESGEHQISDLSSDTPVVVDARDRDVKVAHKKSHSILSGVGSKVKHSISKVRKAITGKSSHPKSASPKYSEKI